MRQRRFRIGALVFAATIVLGVWSASSLASSASRDRAAAKKPVVIGISLSLSGDFSDSGRAAMRGYKLWQAYQNAHGGLMGRKVKLKIVDDTSSPNQAVTNYQTLITRDKVNFVFGPFSTLLTAPSATVVHRYGYAFIEPAGGGPAVFQAKLNNVFFAQPAPAVKNADALAGYILSLPKSKRPKTAAYPMLDDPFAAPPVQRLQGILEKHGIKTVYSKIYPSETTDLTPIVQAVAAAKPQLIAAGTQNADGYAITNGLIQLGYNPKFLYVENGANDPLEYPTKIGKKNTQGILSTTGWYPAEKSFQNKLFVKAYIKKYGGTKYTIDGTSAEAYSCGQILAAAVAKTRSLSNAKIIKALHHGSWKTLQGPLSWDKIGQPKGSMTLVQWIGGKLLPVFPKKVALHTAIAKPHWP